MNSLYVQPQKMSGFTSALCVFEHLYFWFSLVTANFLSCTSDWSEVTETQQQCRHTHLFITMVLRHYFRHLLC